MRHDPAEIVSTALDTFAIELPSWGFANTGTRFGKFLQPAAATTIEEKFSDAGQVHALTGACPTVALHVLWDLAERRRRRRRRARGCGARAGVRAGRHQPEPLSGSGLQVRLVRQSRRRGPRSARVAALPRQRRDRRARSAAATSRCGSPTARTIPARPTSAQRKRWFDEGLARVHAALDPRPAAARRVQAVRAGVLSHRHRRLGHGAAARARAPGRRRRCWSTPAITTSSQNIEQIVAWLLDEEHARRIPLQRSPLCRRRPDARVDRSVSGLPHLPRDPLLRVADAARAPTSPT